MTESPSASLPPAPPVPAATILLLRDGDQGLEVLMMERHGQSSFGSGATVFPGGRIDDADPFLAGHCNGAFDEAALLPRIAAIREAYEECGILLARRAGSAHLIATADVEAFRLQHDKTGTFAAAIEASGLTLATDLLLPLAHWITPAASAKRFDTRFFIAIGPSDQIERHDGHEAVDAIWITPAAALAAADRSERYLMVPTYVILRELNANQSAAAAMEAARQKQIVTVTPEMVRTPAGTIIQLPAESGYDARGVPKSSFRERRS